MKLPPFANACHCSYTQTKTQDGNNGQQAFHSNQRSRKCATSNPGSIHTQARFGLACGVQVFCPLVRRAKTPIQSDLTKDTSSRAYADSRPGFPTGSEMNISETISEWELELLIPNISGYLQILPNKTRTIVIPNRWEILPSPGDANHRFTLNLK